MEHVQRLVAFCLLAAAGCAGDRTNEPRRLVIEDVTLVSPGTPKLPGAAVAIVGDRIVAAGTNIERRSTDSVIAGRGRFLIPGLMDGHVHLAMPAGLPDPATPELAQPIAEYFAQLPRSYLYHGFTTLVDLNVVDREALAAFRRAPAHPDLYDCGPAVPVENGYPLVFLPPEVRKARSNYIADPRQRRVGEPGDTMDHSPKAAVDRATASGGVCVKTFFEDGFGDATGWPTPTMAMMREVREAAHAKSVVHAMHANSYLAWKFASEVPVDLIVHGMWNWDGQTMDGDRVSPAIRAVVDSVVARRIAFMPTLRVIEGLAALYDSTFLADPRLTNVLPSSVIAWYRTPPARAFANELAGGRPEAPLRAGLLRAAEQAALVTRQLVTNGGRLVFGSDSPSGPTYGNPPGLNGYLELVRLAEAGIPLDRLLAAATIETARLFKLDSLYGTIEVGKVANLLLLDADPLVSAAAYDSIAIVVTRGRALERRDLSAR